ncbi:MAG TPA: type IV secretion system protein, partial [Candidatus Megaira endosymbiont of Hartmannula sinica]|nr:type IV secretion system protein [Candidatus Megaera endosymbiont of Hartmannula sinica]
MRYTNILFLLYLIFNLVSCTDQKCIDADDFGHAVITVNSRYKPDDFKGQSKYKQIAPWINSEYRVTGHPMAILIKDWDPIKDHHLDDSQISAWCPWFGTESEGDNLSVQCKKLKKCSFSSKNICPITNQDFIEKKPCVMTKGIGLYSLISNDNPNISVSSKAKPRGKIFYLGYNDDSSSNFDGDVKMTYIDNKGNVRIGGGGVYRFDNDEKEKYLNNNLYFKILDDFYEDNNGSYKVIIKSGISRTNFDPLTYVTNLVKVFLFGNKSERDNDKEVDGGISKQIFLNIVKNNNYKIIVTLLLIFAVAFIGYDYLAGNSNINQGELTIRIIKIIIVSLLINSEHSWTFFYDYLFVYFIDGVDFIISLLQRSTATGPGPTSIIALMLSSNTLAKLFSLLFIDFTGFIYIGLFLYILYFIITILFEFTVTYLTTIVMLSMIIAVGPVFLCFMLFKTTRYLFVNWLKQMTSYAIQPILLFAGMVFIIMIIRHEIYASLGFSVCKHDILKIPETISENGEEKDVSYSPIYWWFPNPTDGSKFTRKMEYIYIPIDHAIYNKDDNRKIDKYCKSYECIGKRYPDLPFLDPEKDQRRIKNFHEGKFIDLQGLFLIFIAVYLLNKVNHLSIAVAKFIGGSSGNYVRTGGVADNVAKGITSNSSYLSKSVSGGVGSFAMKSKTIARGVNYIKNTKNLATGVVGYAVSMPARIIDNNKIKSLRKEAIKNPRNAINNEVRRKFGIDNNSFKKELIGTYINFLNKSIKNLKPSSTQAEVNRIRKNILNNNSRNLENIFATIHSDGKKYKELTKEEKITVDNILKKRDDDANNLKSLAINFDKAKNYSDSYLKAYNSLSKQNIGLIGKKSRLFRNIIKNKNRRNKLKSLNKQGKYLTGKMMYNKYKDIKADSIHDYISGNFVSSQKKYFQHIKLSPNDDIDYSGSNYRKQTYNEIMQSKKQLLNIDRFNYDLQLFNERKGISVVSPQYLAKISNDSNKYDKYKFLANKDIDNYVYKQLTSTQDPLVKGMVYISNVASDSQIKGMIDKIEKAN